VGEYWKDLATKTKYLSYLLEIHVHLGRQQLFDSLYISFTCSSNKVLEKKEGVRVWRKMNSTKLC
jgi:hypothetical protein